MKDTSRASLQIHCDFDGTISTCDSIDEVLERLALPEWHEIEDEWVAGRIGSAECMKRQVELIHGDMGAIEESLADIEIDPTFPGFVKFCETRNLPLTVTSDGVDEFVGHILSRYSLSHLSLRANHLVHEDDGHYSLEFPYSNPRCSVASGNCKCEDLNKDFHKINVLIGDGRSDFCMARNADIVFAKKSLLKHCIEQNIPHYAYENFSDIEITLETILESAVS